MDFKAFIEKMYNTGIVPVIKLENTDNATLLADALMRGGIRCAEVTYRAAGADKVIASMVKAFPDMLVGAGTVLSVEQVDKAVDAGAKFCVAPGLNPAVVEHCLKRGVPFVPGVATASQIETALGLGLDFVKFFPAEQAGGLAYIKALGGPYSNVRFMPTGGINENNINSYLAYDKVVCCGGSWIVPGDAVKNERWDVITALCKSAVDKMLNFSLAHIGVNCSDSDTALANAHTMAKLFGFDVAEGNSSIFSAKAIEWMRSPYLGKNGHIAIATDSLARAIGVLSGRGIEFDADTAKKDKNGKMKAIYLKGEFGGFALHLVERG